MKDAKASAARSRSARLEGARQPPGAGAPRQKLQPRNEEVEDESSRELSMKDAKASAARRRQARLRGASLPRGARARAAEA